MELEVAVRWAMATAAVSSVFAARAERAYRPVAALVCFALLADRVLPLLRDGAIVPVQQAMRATGLDPFVAPLTGWSRVAGHLHQAVWMAWAPAVAATVMQLVAKRRRQVLLPAAAWAGAVVVQVAGYERLRGYRAGVVYAALELVSIGLAIAACAAWVQRRRSPELRHVVALTLVLCECAYTLVYHAGPWGAWDVARAPLLTLFLLLTLEMGGAAWISRSKPRFAQRSP